MDHKTLIISRLSALEFTINILFVEQSIRTELNERNDWLFAGGKMSLQLSGDLHRDKRSSLGISALFP